LFILLFHYNNIYIFISIEKIYNLYRNMPYDNEQNRRIANKIHEFNEDYIDTHPIVYDPNFIQASARKENDRRVPHQRFNTEEKSAMSGFAAGTFRDRGDGEVDGVSDFDYPEDRHGGFKVGDLFDKKYWENLNVSSGSGYSGGNELGAPDLERDRFGAGTSGGFNLGQLGDANFWKNLRIEGGGASGGADSLNIEALIKHLIGLGASGGGASGGFYQDPFGIGDFAKKLVGLGASGGKHQMMPDEAHLKGMGKKMSKKDKQVLMLVKDKLEKDGHKVGGSLWDDFKKGFKMGLNMPADFIQPITDLTPIGAPLNAARGLINTALGLGKGKKHPKKCACDACCGGMTGGKHCKGCMCDACCGAGMSGGADGKDVPQMLSKTLIPKANLPTSSMGSGKKCGGKKSLPPALQKWRQHLMEYREMNPSLSLKECMKRAKESYKK
jgi:hypothetical protein